MLSKDLICGYVSILARNSIYLLFVNFVLLKISLLDCFDSVSGVCASKRLGSFKRESSRLFSHFLVVDFLGIYGQAIKCIRWMPWQSEAMKDVVTCDKPRGVCKLTLIRGFPNGETHLIY